MVDAGTMGDAFLDMFDDEVYSMQEAQSKLQMDRLAQSSYVVLPVVLNQAVHTQHSLHSS